MHSSDTTDGRRYHHNGDFSGEIWIELGPDEIEHGISADMPAAVAKIPLEDLRDIVRAADLQRRMERLEELGDYR